jgi:hypothetical protein
MSSSLSVALEQRKPKLPQPGPQRFNYKQAISFDLAHEQAGEFSILSIIRKPSVHTHGHTKTETKTRQAQSLGYRP